MAMLIDITIYKYIYIGFEFLSSGIQSSREPCEWQYDEIKTNEHTLIRGTHNSIYDIDGDIKDIIDKPQQIDKSTFYMFSYKGGKLPYIELCKSVTNNFI